ncbi:MAG: ATP-binding protein [Ignisphaera sp.]|uniref:ATP-binding protein n=1 Tax=Ignisphaera aggregans TaxID=334771 RepID=A0A7J3MXB5_9CREN
MSHHIESTKTYSFTPIKIASHKVYVVETIPAIPNTRVISILSKISKYFRFPLETNIKLRIRGSQISNLEPEKLSYLVHLLSATILPLYLNKYEPHSQALIAYIDISKDGSGVIHNAALVTKKDAKNLGKKHTLFIALARGDEKHIEIHQLNTLFKMAWLYVSQPLKLNKSIDVSTVPLRTRNILVTFESKIEDKYIEISVPEFHEALRVKIPIRTSTWCLDDLPFRLREEVETIVIKPIASNAPYAPRGIMITGPPGVGKSVTAEIIASALKLKIIELRPSLYRSMWYGLTEKILEGILKNIKSRKNSLVLLDDADFLVGRHVSLHETHVSEITILLRYLQETSRPLTVLTTNVPELLDPALIRPGRIDAVIVMGYPDREFRKRIALRSAEKYKIDLKSELLETIANLTRWFSNAEIEAFIRLAASKGEGRITEETILWARQRFNINEQMRKSIQNQLKWFGEQFQGISIKYVPNESDVL